MMNTPHSACCTVTMAAVAVTVSLGGAARMQLSACVAIAGAGTLLSLWAIMQSVDAYIAAGRYGIDLNKSTTAREPDGSLKRPIEGVKVPEPMGLVPAAVFILSITCFLPFAFDAERMENGQFLELVAALLSITCATFVGFADDVFDVKGRYRISLSFASSLPLLLVYRAHIGRTSMLVPPFLQGVLGTTLLDLGVLYYGILAFQAVFATMAINILAGVNGLESGQAVVIGISIIAFNIVQLARAPQDWEGFRDNQLFSLYIAVPFTAISSALWYHNWWPSAVFCGDTYCYFAGMTIAACAILGHFSKTLWLFLLPQGLNFLYMLPQYLKYPGSIPCPRHRMPMYDPVTGNVKASVCEFHPTELSIVGRAAFNTYRALQLVQVEDLPDGRIRMSNLTLICFFLHVWGPCREDHLCMRLLIFQVLCSGLTFFVRFLVARLFYDEVV